VKKNVAILVFDEVEVLDFAGPFEVFAVTDELRNHEAFHTFTMSLKPGTVRARNGLKIVPDFTLENCPPPHVIVVPGGAGTRPLLHMPALHEWLRTRSRPCEIVLSVCTGALVLAKAGLLDGLRATTHHQCFHELRAISSAIEITESERFVDNGKVVTAAGISSGIDAALHVVELLRGEEKARSIALTLEYDWHADRGFVRGRMADRYLPQLKHLELPEDIQTHDLSAVGDEHHWRRRTHVMTAMPAEELMQRVARATESEGWRRSGDAAEHRWHRDVDGQRVTLAMATKAAEKDAFELVIELAVGNPGH